MKIEDPTIKAAKFWDIKIPKTNPKPAPPGHEFGRDVVRFLNRIGFKSKVKYVEKTKTRW